MIKVFVAAVNGIVHCFKNERNFKIQSVAAVVAILMGTIFNISKSEWFVIILCCTIVLALELMNTAIENLCDMITKEFHPTIKIVKDVSAGAVLVSSIGSAIAGAVIFIPLIVHQIKILL